MEQVERYNYVFEQYDGDSFIYDSKEGERIDDLSQCAYILNKKEKEIERWFEHKKWDAQINRDLLDKIEELETRLSNCIEPKFIVGQKIYVIGTENVEEVEYFGENVDGIITFEEGCRCGCTPDRYSVEKRENIFATEEEAKAKLEEVKK